jgi:hypothetical protein
MCQFTTRNLVTCQGFFARGTHPWEMNAFCQEFTPGKVETRSLDILLICQGYNPWETHRREVKFSLEGKNIYFKIKVSVFM